MGRTFNAVNQTLGKANAIVATYPLSVSVWVNIPSIPSALAVIFDLATTDESTSYTQLFLNTSGYAMVADTGAPVYPTSTLALTINTWYHLGAVVPSTTSRSVYVNGGNSATTTGTATAMAPTVTAWGSQYNSAYSYTGTIAFGAVWQAALTAADFLALSKGISPRRYMPNNLVCYLTDSEGDSPVPDQASATSWIVYGSPPNAGTNPRIYGP